MKSSTLSRTLFTVSLRGFFCQPVELLPVPGSLTGDFDLLIFFRTFFSFYLPFHASLQLSVKNAQAELQSHLNRYMNNHANKSQLNNLLLQNLLHVHEYSVLSFFHKILTLQEFDFFFIADSFNQN